MLKRMSAKKGLEFLRAVSSYMTKTNGYDRCLQQVSGLDGELLTKRITFT